MVNFFCVCVWTRATFMVFIFYLVTLSLRFGSKVFFPVVLLLYFEFMGSLMGMEVCLEMATKTFSIMVLTSKNT